MLEQGWSCEGAAGLWAERSRLGASESLAGRGVLGIGSSPPRAVALSAPGWRPEPGWAGSAREFSASAAGGAGPGTCPRATPLPRDRRGQGRGGTRGPGRADPQAAGSTDRRWGSPAGPGRSRRRAGTARGASGEIAAAAQGTDARRAPKRRDVERVGPRWVGPRLPPGVGQWGGASLSCVHPDREVLYAPIPARDWGWKDTRPGAIKGFLCGAGSMKTVLK